MRFVARLRWLLPSLLLFLTQPGAAADPTPARTEEDRLFQSIEWQRGPGTGHLASTAEIAIPEGFAFTGKDGAKKFMMLTHNPPNDDLAGILIPVVENDQDMWFVVFQWRKEGYIKDDERDKLNADKILESIRKGTEESNKERAKRGWGKVEVIGWERPPYYDPKTNNLTWAIRGRSSDGENVNHSTRMLGREGYMMVDLVLSPEQLAATMPAYDNLMAGFTYTEGHRYAEFRKGDKIAAYGLTALVAGGAGAVAMKTGLLAKFWKLLVAMFLAGAAFVKRLWAKLTGEQRIETPPQA